MKTTNSILCALLFVVKPGIFNRKTKLKIFILINVTIKMLA